MYMMLTYLKGKR